MRSGERHSTENLCLNAIPLRKIIYSAEYHLGGTPPKWYYAARRARLDPVGALKTRVRTDAGRSRRLTPKLLEALHAQYRHHPGWSIKLHYDNLRALLDEQEVPSYDTVRRYMASRGLQRRVEASRQFAPREVRSFEVEHVNSCWHLDFHTGSRNVVTAKGTWIKPSALCILDDCSRLICHVRVPAQCPRSATSCTTYTAR
jgi:putative transposase